MRERHCCKHAANLPQAYSKHFTMQMRSAASLQQTFPCPFKNSFLRTFAANLPQLLLHTCGKHSCEQDVNIAASLRQTFNHANKFAASLQQTFTCPYIEITFVNHCCIQFFKDRFASLLVLIDNFK